MDEVTDDTTINNSPGESAYAAPNAPEAPALANSGTMLNKPVNLAPIRRELLEWFSKYAPPLAPAYEGAVRLLEDAGFPGRVQFISHAVRDICNRLVFVLDPQTQRRRVEYHNDMDAISKEWPKLATFDVEGTSKATPSSQPRANAEEIAIPYTLALRINALVDAHRKGRESPSNEELLFQHLMRMQPTEGSSVNVRIVRDFERTRAWFLVWAHFRDKALPDADEADLRRQFAAFEGMLHSFVGSFFTTVKELDDLLQQATSDQIEAALSMAVSPGHETYFFARLNNPLSIQPLRARKVFDHPPSPQPVEGGGVRHPHWPASKYLARMATLEPTGVAEVFAALNTDNSSVVGDMLDAALAVPIEIAAKLVLGISRAARDGLLWDLHFSHAVNLCVRLAEGGDGARAMVLAEALFAPPFRNGEAQPRSMDEYWYEDGMTKVLPVMVALRPRDFLLKLCEWLERSIISSQRVDPNTGADQSHLWRPAIEEHEQNRDRDFLGMKVGFARKGFEQAIDNGAMKLEEAFVILDRFRYLLFKRLRLHLIAEFADKDALLCRQTIMDRELFDDHLRRHEYARLTGRRFDLLTDQERETWLQWVDAGPDESELVSLNEEQRQDHAVYWRFKRLHWVRDHLEGKRKQFYQEMVSERGRPKLADLPVYFETGWGHISPMTVEELAGLSFEEVIKLVSSWRPGTERGFDEPEVEGLASTFEKYLAGNSARFSKDARLLIDAPAVYVRTFIGQMAKAAKEGGDIDLGAVLDLCDWVLTRPVAERTTPESRGPLADHDWQWTRDEIASFVQVLCKATAGDRPKYTVGDWRKRFWSLINSLCRDRAESYIARDIAAQDPRVHDYLDLAINSPRGKAVEAALAYARWVADQVKTVEGPREVGFDSMPEVRELLDWQIVPGNRSIVGLAVIGAQLNLVYWIEKEWLEKNATRLFNLRGIEESPGMGDGWAAWNAFLIWMAPHIEYYRLFKEEYAYAVAQCSQVEPSSDSREQPLFHLAEHLMLFYGRGQLALDDDGGLLRRFLHDAHPDIRRHAIDFVGRSLQGENDVPEDVVKRFMVLWEEYWPGTGRNDAGERPNAQLFGPWFASGKFPVEWALPRLEEFAQAVALPQPDFTVLEQLVSCAEADIARVIRILDRMIRGDSEGWRIFRWRESVKRLLESGMRTSGDSRRTTIELINYLGRRGYTELGELLHTE